MDINSVSKQTQRLYVASLIISNLITITRSVCQIEIAAETALNLYDMLFRNVNLMSESTLVGEGIEDYRVIRKPETRRRQSRRFRPGFFLDQAELMTEKQQSGYEAGKEADIEKVAARKAKKAAKLAAQQALAETAKQKNSDTEETSGS